MFRYFQNAILMVPRCANGLFIAPAKRAHGHTLWMAMGCRARFEIYGHVLAGTVLSERTVLLKTARRIRWPSQSIQHCVFFDRAGEYRPYSANITTVRTVMRTIVAQVSTFQTRPLR